MEELAKKKDAKMAQIALAWTMAKVTAPIVGTTNLSNLEELLGMCARVTVLWLEY